MKYGIIYVYLLKASAAARQGVSERMDNLNKVTLELNPNHLIVKKLKEMVDEAPNDKETLNFASLLYDVASLASGYSLDDPSTFSNRVNILMER